MSKIIKCSDLKLKIYIEDLMEAEAGIEPAYTDLQSAA